MDCGHMTHVAAGSCEQVIARRAIAGSSSISDCKSESRDRLLSLQATPCGSGPVGRAPASQAGGRGFESRLPLQDRGDSVLARRQTAVSRSSHGHAFVAQWIERPPPERKVAGSNPVERTYRSLP